MPTPTSEIHSWTRQDGDVTYTISTDPALIQVDALDDALSSDLLWWCEGLGHETLRKVVEHSLCFGIYARPTSTGM